MSFLKPLFLHETPVDIEISNKVQTVASGEILESYESVYSGKGYFWQGSQAEALTGERIRARVRGVIALDPADVEEEIENGAKATIDSRNYSIITEDNVLQTSELYVYPVEEFS